MQCDGTKLRNLAPQHVNRLHRRSSLDSKVIEEAEEEESSDEEAAEEDGVSGAFACCRKPAKSVVVEEPEGAVPLPGGKVCARESTAATITATQTRG